MRRLFAGKRAFIAGVADDNGYGWAIAKSLAAAGAEILVGTWVPVSKSSNLIVILIHMFKFCQTCIVSDRMFHSMQALNIFENSLRRGKFDESRV